MKEAEIIAYRLASQLLDSPGGTSPAAIVRHFGAMQAQDYLASLWAVGLRMSQPAQAAVEQSLIAGEILRTWPMRGTIHLVAAEDARWLVELCAPRIERAAAGRHRQLGLNEALFQKATEVLAQAIHSKKQLTRAQCMQLLENAGISTESQRGYHILWMLAVRAQICFGPHQGKQPTFVLLHEWAPQAKSKPRDEALAELTNRYFTSHGPATQYDFMWWSGLTAADVKAGLAMNEATLTNATIDNNTYWWPKELHLTNTHTSTQLLPSFDEYLIGYKDRSAVLEEVYKHRVTPGGNGIFNPLIVINGQVVGTWKRTIRKETVVTAIVPFTKLTPKELQTIWQAAEHYASFIGKTLVKS